MSAWLESHQSLRHHPKTRRLARLLGVSIPAAIGHLHCLWWWCMEYAPDGDLTGVDPDVIADAASWDGEPQALLDALVAATRVHGGCGFLERDGDRLLVHDWMQYAGVLIARRQADAARKREGRRLDVRRTSGGRPADGARTNQPTNLKTHMCDSAVDNSQSAVDNSPECDDLPAVDATATIADDGFTDFWSLYPRKVGKAETERRWSRLSARSRDAAFRAAANLAAYVTASGAELRYVPHPATFIGPKRLYEDWAAGVPPGYGDERAGAAKRESCPECETDLTWDEEMRQRCPFCGWRPS